MRFLIKWYLPKQNVYRMVTIEIDQDNPTFQQVEQIAKKLYNIPAESGITVKPIA